MEPPKLSSFLQSRELAGMVFGVAVAAVSPSWGRWLESPPLSLFLFVVVAMAAACMVGASVARAGYPMELAVRRGTGAGALAFVVAGSFLLWGVGRAGGGSSVFRAWLIWLVSVMPVLVTGSVAAGLAAWRFRRQVTPLPALVEFARIYRWPALGLIGTGFLVGALAPWIARSVPSREAVTVSSAPSGARYTAPVSPPAPRVTFSYKTPIELTTASPVAWKIKEIRDLGPMNTERGVAFSHDQRFLAWGESDSMIAVHDLESDGVRRISGIPYAVKDMAFSPDGERLFVIMRGQPFRVGVGFLQTDRFVLLPQPKKYAVPDGPASWWKEDEVVFVPKSGPVVSLNLDRLEVYPSRLSPGELAKIKRDQALDFPSNSRWAFGKGSVLTFAERPEVEVTREWNWQSHPAIVLADLERASSRIFMAITPASGDVYFGVNDGSKLMQVREGRLSVYYFERGAVPPLRWKIKMPYGPEQMKDPEVVQGALAKGQLSLLMYAPLVNSLNEKIVGPNRERPKAILRVLRWEGSEAEVWIEAGAELYFAGDVFSDLHVPGDPPQLLDSQEPIPWWVMVPEPLPDATDPRRLPLRKDLEKKHSDEKKTQLVPSVKLPVAAVAPPEMEFDDIKKSVTTFVFAHHAAASEGRLQDVVDDYAERVDHFSNGFANHTYILLEEIKYRQKYKFVWGNVRGNLNIRKVGEGKVEVSYAIGSEWQRLADNTKGSNVSRVTLTLEAQPRGWKIVKHRADKQN